MRTGIKKRWIFLLVIVLLLIVLTATGMAGELLSRLIGDNRLATPSTSGSLHVVDGKLLGDNGEQVQLRGISTHGLSWYPEYVNEDAFRQLRNEWKANVIRLALYPADHNGYCTGGNQEELKELVRKGVEYATAQDMYVIIDWHTLTDTNPNTYKDQAKIFFHTMSRELADHNNVIYEICNEPNGTTSWWEVKKYAEEVIPYIRANDEDAVIIVGTPYWCQEVDKAVLSPITGYENIMYSLHFYAATHGQALRDTMVNAIKDGLPIFVSEYGICNSKEQTRVDEEEATRWIKTLDQYGISYVAWNLSNKDEASAFLKSTVHVTNNFLDGDLTDSGRWVKKTLTSSASKFGFERIHAIFSDLLSKQNGGLSITGESGLYSSAFHNSYIVTEGDIKATATLVENWLSSGRTYAHYVVKLENTGDTACPAWSIPLPFEGTIYGVDCWGCELYAYGNNVTISSTAGNGVLQPGDTLEDIGFVVRWYE